MKYIFPTLLLISIFLSCKSEPATVIDAERLVGEFVRVRDNGRGGKENTAHVETITFRSKFCNFTYEGTPMSGKYSVDEGYVYIEAGGDLGTLSLEIISENQLEGEGKMNGTFMREGHEEEVEGDGKSSNASSSNSVNSSSSASDNNESNNGSSSSSNENDEKSSSSNGTQNNATTNSSSNGTSGSGSNSGTVAEKRYVVQHVNTSNMRSPAAAKVGLILTIDPQGNVVSTQLDRAKTTTTNQVLVNSVISEVKNQVKYNKVSGSSYAKVSYIVKL